MCEEASRRATPDRAGARPYQRLRGSRDGTSLPAPTWIARRRVPCRERVFRSLLSLFGADLIPHYFSQLNSEI